MPNSDTTINSTPNRPFVCATILVGAQTEPFFATCLESVADAVDYAVVDLNGNYEENAKVLENSRLYKEKRMRIENSVFKDYSTARNNTFDMLPPETKWVMRLDADEVHFPHDLQKITREIIPYLDESVGMLDTYWLCFFHSFKYVTKLERRHDLFIRYHKGMKWERSIHEQLIGRQGKRLAAPYIFHHYANIKDPEEFLQKVEVYIRMSSQYSSLQKGLARDPINEIMMKEGRKEGRAPELMKARFLQERDKTFLYNGQYPEVNIDWLDPNKAPDFIKLMQEELDAILEGKAKPQHGGKRRILFRLPSLLFHLKTWYARKQALHLAATQLKKSLP